MSQIILYSIVVGSFGGLIYLAYNVISTTTEPIAPKEPFIRQEVLDGSIETSVFISLKNNPEQSVADLKTSIESAQTEHIRNAAEDVFKSFIRQHELSKARHLLDYHSVEEHNLLSVMEGLDHNEQTGTLDLSPQTYKIVLEDGETAYEKLPCNWQKIHTYLAPLTDELEQSDILDTGNIYITDQRVFFVGKKGSETVSLSDIAYMDLKDDALQFFRDEGLSEIFAFPTAHHAKYAELVIKELMGREA